MTVHSSSQVELLRDPDQLQQQKDPMTKGNREGIKAERAWKTIEGFGGEIERTG